MPGEREQQPIGRSGQLKTARAGLAEPVDAVSTPSDEQPRREIGGPKGPEPTRYGDWERAGRCIDF